jgi:crotonobetainyl-CoA hydratase
VATEANQDARTAEPAVLVKFAGPAEDSRRIMIATINRPAAMNTSNGEVADGIGAALEAAEADDRVRAVIVTGAGDRAFCAGVDLKAALRGDELYAAGHADWGFAGFTRHMITKPTIAAVNGVALGGGAEIILAADLVVAAESASIGLPEVSLGLFAAAGGAVRLPGQIPPKIAMEMLLTGEPITAARAYQLGLVNQLAPAGRALPVARALAERICASAPLAVRASKIVARRLVDGQLADEQAAWAHSAREHALVRASSDAREGIRAFAEKRTPAWQMR